MIMKTRFNEIYWKNFNGCYRLCDMDTDHLLNILKMFKSKPNVVMNMLIQDIENSPDCSAFSPFGVDHSNIVKQSLQPVTSMSTEEISMFALKSPLGIAIKHELISRGVNVENYLSMIDVPEKL